jgi:acyl-CoA thioesterase
VTSRFARDTAVVPLGDGTYEGHIDPGWWIERGPNGGYVAAVVLRALTDAVANPERTPRSLTVHYLAPPVEGPVRIETAVVRSGRMLTFVSGRLLQADRLLATAQAAFAPPLPGVVFSDMQPPDVPPPDDLPTLPPVEAGDPLPVIAMRDRYEQRWAIGPLPFTGASQAVAGGWIRLNPEEGSGPVDHVLVAALCDAWVPPIFSRVDERVGVPTIDLTVHFREPLPAGDTDWFLVVFRSQMAADGFVEEDGEVWTASGRLLAHSRQLAVILPAVG